LGAAQAEAMTRLAVTAQAQKFFGSFFQKRTSSLLWMPQCQSVPHGWRKTGPSLGQPGPLSRHGDQCCFPPTKRKAFFFEKNQKTFVCLVPRKLKR
jgi:hypothetical protein